MRASAGIALVLLVASFAQARTIRVPSEHPTIASAIDAAVRGDVVEIECGTYYEHDLVMKSGITVRGAGGPVPCVTIDAELLGRGFLVDECDSTTVFEGLRILRGNSPSDSRGGGMFIVSSAPLIRRCEFIDCVGWRGKAIAAQDGFLTSRLEECRFTRSGIQLLRDTAMIASRCVFVDSPVAALFTSTVRVSRSTCIRSSVGKNHASCRAVVETSVFSGQAPLADSVLCCVVPPTNPQFCTPNGPDYFVSTSSPCLRTSGTCAGIIGAYGAGCGSTTPITVTTEPPGHIVRVDGTDRATPATFTWYPMSEHHVAVDSTFGASGSVRHRFVDWSDGGGAAHHAVIFPGATTLTARVRTQYRVTTRTVSEPGGGGTVSPSPAWADAGHPFELTAVPAAGSAFAEWTGSGPGSYSGPANPAPIVAAAPLVQVARFVPLGYELSVSASDTDPFVHVAVPTNGPRPLYLWLTCARGGLAAFEGQLTGSLPRLGFLPAPGVLNAGSGDHLLLAVADCPTGTATRLLLGTIWVQDAGGDICVGPTASGPALAVDCGAVVPSIAPDPGITGFASSGAACRAGSRGCATGELPIALPPARTAPSGILLEEAYPNPFATVCTLAFTMSAAGTARAEVFDVAGRRVRTLRDGALPAGRQEIVWNGDDDAGRATGAGIYFLRVSIPGDATTVRVVRLGGMR